MDKQLKLGLDLKGGVHLVLRVQTDDALRLETEQEMERLREELTDARTSPSPTSTRPTRRTSGSKACRRRRTRRSGRPPTKCRRTSTAAPASNGTYTFTMKPNIAGQPARRSGGAGAPDDRAPRQRARRHRAEHRAAGRQRRQILVQLPGVTDVERAKEIIRSTGLLELKIVEQGPAPTQRSAARRTARCRRAWRSCPASSGAPGDAASTVYYLVRKVAAVTGQRPAQRARLGRREQPAGGQLHAEQRRRPQVRQGHRREHRPAARDHPRRPRAVGAAHRVADHTDGRITGSFTQEEVQNLSLILRSGALPATLDLSRGADDRPEPRRRLDPLRRASRRSVGLLLVIVFMLVYYKLSGVNAVVALIFNLVILLGLMAYIGAVMTLPGIAGFVLTMGIGVDSNVLIFERIKEELEAQRGVRASINAGFSRVFWTLFDTHIAALISVRVPVPVRHRPDPRLRRDAVLRSGVEPVHVDFRVEDAVRAGARRAGSRSRRCPSKPCISSRTPTSTSCAGAGTRSRCPGSSSSPASSCICDQGHSAGRRVRRRHRR